LTRAGDAAIAVSKREPIDVCKKCGKELQYRIEHTYANDPNQKQHPYIVIHAVRLGTRLESENYDPYLLVIRNVESGEEQILPTFWALDNSGMWRGGQFPPMLSLEEWKTLFRQLDASF
jgi:hypothetical protein